MFRLVLAPGGVSFELDGSVQGDDPNDPIRALLVYDHSFFEEIKAAKKLLLAREASLTVEFI